MSSNINFGYGDYNSAHWQPTKIANLDGILLSLQVHTGYDHDVLSRCAKIVDAELRTAGRAPEAYYAALDCCLAIDRALDGTRLSKRISRAIFDKMGFRLTDSALSKIGELSAAYVGATAFDVSLTDVLAWDTSDNEWGDSGSCFSKSDMYLDARTYTLPKIGASAILARNLATKKGGRAWIINCPQYDYPAWYISNAYGCISGRGANLGDDFTITLGVQLFAKIAPELGTMIGTPMHHIDCPRMYSNGDGVLIHSPRETKVIGSTVHFPYNCRENSTIVLAAWCESENARCAHIARCCECGAELNDDDAQWDEDGEYCYCDDCYNQHFTQCELCEETMRRDYCECEVATAQGTIMVCEDCASRYAVQCADCGDFILIDGPRYCHVHTAAYGENCEGETVCESCAGEYAQCENCESICRRDDMAESRPSEYLCEECAITISDNEAAEREKMYTTNYDDVLATLDRPH